MKYVNQNINKNPDWCVFRNTSEKRRREGCWSMRNIPFRGYVHYCSTSKNLGWTLTDESFNSLKFVLFWSQKLVEVIKPLNNNLDMGKCGPALPFCLPL